MRGICFAALSPTVIWEPPSGRRGIYKEVHFPAIHYHHRQATLPDVGDRRRLRAAAGRRKPVEVLDGAQHVEVIDPLAELPGRDHRSDEDGGMRLPWRSSSSSKVRMKRLLWVFAHRT